MLTLHDDPISGNGYKIRLLLAFFGTAYEYKAYDIIQGETRTSEFLNAVNPAGRIPVLELDDGRKLPESNAVLTYLGEGTPWVPVDPFTKAQMMSWLFWEQYSHEPNIATLRFWNHLPELTDAQKAQIDGKRSNGEDALTLMNMQLSYTDWLVGDGPTLADIALYAYTHVAEECDYKLSAYPAVQDWIKRFAALPGYVSITDKSGV
jgi:glutathione S-transferase